MGSISRLMKSSTWRADRPTKPRGSSTRSKSSGGKRRIVLDPVDQVMIGGPVLQALGRGQRVHAYTLVQVLAVTAGLDGRHQDVFRRHER